MSPVSVLPDPTPDSSSATRTMTGETRANDELYAIAKIVRPRGFKGEVIADVLTDFPERFTERQRELGDVRAVWPNGEVSPVEIENAWFHKGRVVLKLAGCESEETAESYREVVLAISRDQLSKLPADTWYQADLIGCDVLNGGDRIGSVERVLEYGAAPLLVVRTDGAGTSGRELLIPLTRSICKEIDVEQKRITIDPPEGLLEL